MDGSTCNVLMFKGKNRLSHEIVVLLFEGHMRRVSQMFLCSHTYSQSAWHLKVKDGGCGNVLLGEDCLWSNIAFPQISRLKIVVPATCFTLVSLLGLFRRLSDICLRNVIAFQRTRQLYVPGDIYAQFLFVESLEEHTNALCRFLPPRKHTASPLRKSVYWFLEKQSMFIVTTERNMWTVRLKCRKQCGTHSYQWAVKG